MKTFTKLLLVLFIGLISFVTTAQNEDTIPITETERIIDKYGGKIIDGFNNMIENVTPYAEEGFKIVVKLKIAEGIVYLLPLFFSILGWILFRREYARLDEEDTSYGPFDETNFTAWLLITLIFSSIMTISAMLFTGSGIMYLIAPEWYAIKEILNLI